LCSSTEKYIKMCTHICTRTDTHAPESVVGLIYIKIVHTQACTHMHTHAHTCTYMHTHTHTHTYTHTRTHAHTHTHTHAHTHTRTHTHTHTHTPEGIIGLIYHETHFSRWVL